MLIDLARERATRAIRERLMAARGLAATSGNMILLQQIDDALRSLDGESPAAPDPAVTKQQRVADLSTKAD